MALGREFEPSFRPLLVRRKVALEQVADRPGRELGGRGQDWGQRGGKIGLVIVWDRRRTAHLAEISLICEQWESVVFYLNAKPVAIAASVAKQAPLTLSTSDRNASLLEIGKRALLILQDGGQFAKAEAQIISCEPFAEGWRIEAGQFGTDGGGDEVLRHLLDLGGGQAA